MKFNKDILKEAKINAPEFARYIKYTAPNGEVRTVTKMAVYNWLRGASVSKPFREEVNRVLNLIASAVDTGDLPIENKSRTSRARELDYLLGSE